jgi:tripartite-type tricarboxylate transporter receptor subunit TctC
MTSFRMSLSRRALLALPVLAALPADAQTETFPTKAIRIIVPFAPGGSGDITARLVGKYIEDKTGQPFVVENKPGANRAARRLHTDAGHDLDQRGQRPHVQEPGL